MLVHLKMSYVQFLWLVVLCGTTIVSDVTSQRSDITTRSNEFAKHASGRHFIPASNSDAGAGAAVAISQLVLESHHEVTPSAQPLHHHTVPPPTAVSATAWSLERLAAAVHANPVLAALLINTLLGANNGVRQYNSPPVHEPPNPYVALLLSNYGRYIPRPGATSGHGLYSYNAANNIHNTRPFGAYKIYEDSS